MFSPKMNIGMMLAASTAIQASSLLLKKAISTFSDRENGLFCCPEMCLTVRQVFLGGYYFVFSVQMALFVIKLVELSRKVV